MGSLQSLELSHNEEQLLKNMMCHFHYTKQINKSVKALQIILRINYRQTYQPIHFLVKQIKISTIGQSQQSKIFKKFHKDEETEANIRKRGNSFLIIKVQLIRIATNWKLLFRTSENFSGAEFMKICSVVKLIKKARSHRKNFHPLTCKMLLRIMITQLFRIQVTA